MILFTSASMLAAALYTCGNSESKRTSVIERNVPPQQIVTPERASHLGD